MRGIVDFWKSYNSKFLFCFTTCRMNINKESFFDQDETSSFIYFLFKSFIFCKHFKSKLILMYIRHLFKYLSKFTFRINLYLKIKMNKFFCDFIFRKNYLKLLEDYFLFIQVLLFKCYCQLTICNIILFIICWISSKVFYIIYWWEYLLNIFFKISFNFKNYLLFHNYKIKIEVL